MGNLQYGYLTDKTFEGEILTTNRNTRTLSANTVLGNKYPFGRGIKWNNSNKQIVPLSSGTDKFLGVLIRSALYEDFLDSDGFYGYPDDNQQVTILATGDIGVYVETDINHNDLVYVRHTANGAGKDRVGVFRTDDDGGTCLLVPNGVWLPVWESLDGLIAKAGSIAPLSLS